MPGRGTDERINATPVVAGTGARPGRVIVHLGMTSGDGPATVSTQLAGRGGSAQRSDATGSSGQTVPKLADMTLSESRKEWLVGGRSESCDS